MQITQQNSVSRSPVPRRYITWLTTFVMLVGLVFIALEWDYIRQALAEATWSVVPFALVTTAISYLCISLSFAGVSKLLRVEMGTVDLMSVGFISVVINHVVASGGAAGFSVRYSLMSRYGETFSRVMAVSILHFVITSVVMIGMLPVGLLYLLRHATLPNGIAQLLGALTVFVMTLGVVAIALIFSGTLRSRLFGFAERAVRVLLNRDPGKTLQRFDATMTEGTAAMLRRPIVFVALLMLVAVDWIASAATLWFAFLSLGVVVPPGTLISGFVIGIVAGAASLVPGGLGVQEGTMAGVFALLGLDFSRSVLAAVFYRFIYFVIPYFISLGFYRWLMRKDKRNRAVSESEVGHAHPNA